MKQCCMTLSRWWLEILIEAEKWIFSNAVSLLWCWPFAWSGQMDPFTSGEMNLFWERLTSLMMNWRWWSPGLYLNRKTEAPGGTLHREKLICTSTGTVPPSETCRTNITKRKSTSKVKTCACQAISFPSRITFECCRMLNWLHLEITPPMATSKSSSNASERPVTFPSTALTWILKDQPYPYVILTALFNIFGSL